MRSLFPSEMKMASVVSAADGRVTSEGQPMGDVVEHRSVFVRSSVFVEEERDGEMFARRTQP